MPIQNTKRQNVLEGSNLIKEAICELLREKPGLRSNDIVRALNLRSRSPDGSQQGWLCWAFLQVLVSEERVNRIGTLYSLNMKSGFKTNKIAQGGAYLQKAQKGTELVKDSICELLRERPALGATAIARELGILDSPHQHTYRVKICYGFLQVLQCEKRVKKIRTLYSLNVECGMRTNHIALGGVYLQKTQIGAQLIKEAVCELLSEQPGLRCSDIAQALNLRSQWPDGTQKNWACWGFLQILQCEERVKKIGRQYYINEG